VVATVTTTGNGRYSFPNLGPGLWTIEEVNQSGWYQTQPVNPPGTYVFAAVSGTSESGLNFGNFQEITLSGLVYNDLNGDGKKQGKEPGLANWTVELLNTSGNVVAAANTDASGNYSIGQVFPGTFTLVVIVQPGWVQTQPVNPPYYTIQPLSGQNQTGLVFGVHYTGGSSQPVTIDNGQSGYAETGTSTTAGGGFNGSNRYTATGSTDIATGTVDVGQAPGANISTLGASSGPATTPTMSISGVRNSTRMTVLYNRDLPPQGNQPALPSLVDTVLSQYGAETTQSRATEAITSLAFDLVSSKKSKR
jgi:hypothetical protein